MAKTIEYEVELLSIPASGAKKTMYRNGVQFEVKVPQVLELTKEEREIFEDDKRFSISEATESTGDEDSSVETNDSEEDAPVSDSDSSEEDDSSEDQDNEDSSSDEEEASSDEAPEDGSSEEASPTTEEAPVVTVDKLVKDNSRDQINALAKEAKVENPEALETKREVAEAIVKATS